nr:MAG TPA: hypothetical protein [Caudoviricetes sp.]
MFVPLRHCEEDGTPDAAIHAPHTTNIKIFAFSY